VTQHDRHATRLLQDLITHRDKIFKDLKRHSVKKARPESLDESQRRQRYETRSRAISAAARSPRIQPADLANGSDKSPGPQNKRLSGVTGVTGILGNRPPSLSLDPGDTLVLDSGLPAGGQDEQESTEKTGSVEVTVTDETQPAVGDVVKKPSLGRTTRISAGRVGLQRHLKRESVQQVDPTAVAADKDAAAVAASVRRSLEEGRPVGVTLTDGPPRE